MKNRETGPGPERTARGAGREATLRLREVDLLDVPDLLEVRELGFRLGDRVLEPVLLPDVRLEPDEDEDVLLLRDPGGEDVRVAMRPP